MKEELFSAEESWHGSCYELVVSDPKAGGSGWLSAAIKACWRTSELIGPVAGPYAEHGQSLHQVDLPVQLSPLHGRPMFGVLRLPLGQEVGVQVLVDQAGRLVVCIPTGMLTLVYKLAYPLVPKHNLQWMEEVNSVLLNIAQSIYTSAPFNLAIIGEEAGAVYPGEGEITVQDLDGYGFYIVSPALLQRLQPVSDWKVLPSGLRWRSRLDDSQP